MTSKEVKHILGDTLVGLQKSKVDLNSANIGVKLTALVWFQANGLKNPFKKQKIISTKYIKTRVILQTNILTILNNALLDSI